MTSRTFDRIARFDPRSRAFAAVSTLPHNNVRSYTWRCGTWNDQGQEGACVGFAWSHELAARPAEVPTTEAQARLIYHEAQKLDEWAGESYEGTSVLAGVKAVKANFKNAKGVPLIGEYRWAFGVEDLVRVLGYRGPAVLGINWYSGMFNTDAGGFIHKTGSLAGGHAILARAVKLAWVDPHGPREFSNTDQSLSYVTLRNSWGRAWGMGGDCRVSLSDLGALLQEQGDACIPVVRTF
jgi:hypothetical protein